MWWLSFVGPLLAALVYALTGHAWRPDRRRAREIERWRVLRSTGRRREIAQDATAYRGGKEVIVSEVDLGRAPRRVTSLPGTLARALQTTGGGERIAIFELCPKLAYLAVMGPDLTQGSDHVTVLAKLDEAGPTLTVRPLPIEEGSRIPNTGVHFEKDPELTASILIEPAVDGSPAVVTAVTPGVTKAIRKWLSPPLREAILELPDAWLRVDGKARTMAYTLYGPTDAHRIQELIAAADIVFAEYGAAGGPSLLGEGEEEAPAEEEAVTMGETPNPPLKAPPKEAAPPRKKKAKGGAKSRAKDDAEPGTASKPSA
jgi:hypothetical protein